MSSSPIDVSGSCEDAGIYYSATMGVFRAVFHCGCNYQAMWSLDGVVWERTTPQQPWCNVTYSGKGQGEVFKRRERPKWVIDGGTGQPLAITNGVWGGTSHGGRSFTLATAFV